MRTGMKGPVNEVIKFKNLHVRARRKTHLSDLTLHRGIGMNAISALISSFD